MPTHQTQQIARFALRRHRLPPRVADRLKLHLLDSLASLLWALGQDTPRKLKRQIELLGEGGPCPVPGLGTHALAIAGCSFLSVAAGRASPTPEWKGLASALTALGTANALLLAAQGVTGPMAVFEGPAGYDKSLKMKLDYDWSGEAFDLIEGWVLKRYNAEVHTQTAIEAVLALQRAHRFSAQDIERVELAVFRTCYDITGGGEYGDRKTVGTKEQADHSLPYVVAVALLDGDVYPAQLAPGRIARADVQSLLRRVGAHTIVPAKAPDVVHEHMDPLTRHYPDVMPVKVTITLKDGRRFERRQDDFPGFFTRPQGWADVEQKFRRLTAGCIGAAAGERVIAIVRALESNTVAALMEALDAAAAP